MLGYAVRSAARSGKSTPQSRRAQRERQENSGGWLAVVPFVYVMAFIWHWSATEIIVVPTVIIMTFGIIYSIAQQRPKPSGAQAAHLQRMTEHQRILQAQRAWEAARLAQMAQWKEQDEKWRGMA
jgi:hypothetical protein